MVKALRICSMITWPRPRQERRANSGNGVNVHMPVLRGKCTATNTHTTLLSFSHETVCFAMLTHVSTESSVLCRSSQVFHTYILGESDSRRCHVRSIPFGEQLTRAWPATRHLARLHCVPDVFLYTSGPPHDAGSFGYPRRRRPRTCHYEYPQSICIDDFLPP